MRPAKSCPGRSSRDRRNLRPLQIALAPVSEPLLVDLDQFDEVVNTATVPVLLDFWARWCSPCRFTDPEVERTAASMAGRAIVLKIDVDDHPGVARRFGNLRLPLFVVFSGGRSVKEHTGTANQAQMEDWLKSAKAATA